MAITGWQADGSALSDHTTFVRVVSEGGNSLRGGNPTVPQRHGDYHVQKWYGSGDLLLEVGLKTDDAYTHLSELQAMFAKPSGLVTLRRVTPYQGTVEADVELLGSPAPTQNRFVYMFPLNIPSGSWRDATWSTASGSNPSITTSGDRPIDDMIVTFSAAGSATYVGDRGTAVLGWEGSGTAVVDCGARTVTQGGSNVDADFTVTQPWWLEFAANESVSLTSTVSVTVDWRNRWAAG